MRYLLSPGFKTYFRDQFRRSALLHGIVRLLVFLLLCFEVLSVASIFTYRTQFTWHGLANTLVILFFAIEIIAYRYYTFKHGKLLSAWVWILGLAGLLLDFTADAFHLYARFEWWDQVLHFASSAVACFVVFIIFSAFWLDTFKFRLMHRIERLQLGIFVSVVSAFALGALYEIEEYAQDLLYGSHLIGPGTDTANDLSFDLMGVALTGVILWVVLSRRKKRLLGL